MVQNVTNEKESMLGILKVSDNIWQRDAGVVGVI